MSIQSLKQLPGSLDRILDNDEAVHMSAEVRMLADEYAHLDQPVPEWLENVSDILRMEIAKRNRASDAAELRRVEAELDSLKTVGERKSAAMDKLAFLQKKLGLTGKQTAGSPRRATAAR